jgi:uncharacterized protein
MIHPDTELRFLNGDVGYGVVATKFIPKGTITWVLDKLDRTFTPLQIIEMGEVFQEIINTYCYRNRDGNLVLCWDMGRFVNHSFNSSCISTAYDFEFAVRDIHPGEELTDDYGYLNIDEPFRAVDEGGDRKIVYPDDLIKYHPMWDKKLISAFRAFPTVPQPLGGLIPAETMDLCHRIAVGQTEMASIISCYYDPNR